MIYKRSLKCLQKIEVNIYFGGLVLWHNMLSHCQWLQHSNSSSLPMNLGEQWKMAQISGMLDPCGQPRCSP